MLYSWRREEEHVSEDETFKVGDVVWLKSGGPSMTVTEVGPMMFCEWFANNVTSSKSFPPDALTKKNPKPVAML